MTDALNYKYPSPLEGYETLPALGEELQEDGKSVKNPPAEQQSPAYQKFTNPLDNGSRGGFDIHIYFHANHPYELQFAKELRERIRREFPELRVYKLWEKNIGPHGLPMFEVNVFNPHQFGAFITWLAIHRGPLSALVHPNTDDEFRDHSQRAIWMGPQVTLNLRMLKDFLEKDQEEKQSSNQS